MENKYNHEYIPVNDTDDIIGDGKDMLDAIVHLTEFGIGYEIERREKHSDDKYENIIINAKEQNAFNVIFLYKFITLVTLFRFYGMYIDPGYKLLNQIIFGF
jgi:hypothetical protein